MNQQQQKKSRPMPANSRVLSVDLAYAMMERRQLSAAGWSVDDERVAYAVHDGLAEMFGWYENENAPQYWKSGGPSREARLTHAPLPPERVRQSVHAEDGIVDLSDIGLPTLVAEVEIALRIARPVAAWEADTLTPAATAALVHSFAVTVELCASRWQEGAEAPALLRLADLQSNAGLAIGEWQPWTPAQASHDWAAQACSLQVNDEPAQRAAGTHPLGDPLWGLTAWLKHLTRFGDVAPGGSVVTTGAWIIRRDVKPGDRLTAAFDGIGSLTLKV